MKSILFSRRRGVSAKVSGSGAPVINAPSGLSIVLNGTTATIGWTNNAGSSAQTSIEHSLTGTSGWAETVLTAAAAQTTEIAGLAAGPHYFRLRAKVGTDYSGYPVQTLSTTVVFSVANFAASVSGTTVNLSWDAHNAGLAQTVIERSANSGATWSALATVAAGTNTYASTGNASGAYLYRARALIGTTYSVAYTASASATVISVPSSFAASVSGTAITLTWTDANSGAAQTVIERSTDAGATWSALTTVAAGTNSYANSGLSAGSYYYRARALIGSTHSGYTSTTSGTVASGPASFTALYKNNFDSLSVGAGFGAWIRTVVDNTRSVSGTKCLKISTNSGMPPATCGGDHGFAGRTTLPVSVPVGNRIWLAYKVYHPSRFSWSYCFGGGDSAAATTCGHNADGSGFLKYMVMAPDNGGGRLYLLPTTQRRNFTQIQEMACISEVGAALSASVASGLTPDAWHTVQMEVLVHNNASTGYIRYWVDNVYLGQKTCATVTASTAKISEWGMGDYFNGVPYTDSIGDSTREDFWLDEVIVATDMAGYGAPTGTDSGGRTYIDPATLVSGLS